MKIQFTSVDLALAALAFIWALNFTVIKASLNEIDSYSFNALQFLSVMITTGMISLTILAIPNINDTNWNNVSHAAYGGAAYNGALSIGLAYLAWNIGHIRIGTVQTAAYINMVTVPGMGGFRDYSFK